MNKKVIVIYSSKYGSTKQYAKWIAEALTADLAEAKTVKPESLQSYDVVIYGGGLYAGGISGIKLVSKNTCKKLVVFTVGLSNPSSTDYSGIINKNLTPDLTAKVKIFHLRGAIDYKQLGPVHRIMMAMMKNMINRKPESERKTDDRDFLKTYGSSTSFTEIKNIKPLVSYVKSL